MPWLRLTHAETGKPIDINLTPASAIFPMDGGRTEIAVVPGLMYYVLETPDEMWAALKKANHADYDKATWQPYIQVRPPTKLVKTSAKPRRK